MGREGGCRGTLKEEEGKKEGMEKGDVKTNRRRKKNKRIEEQMMKEGREGGRK